MYTNSNLEIINDNDSYIDSEGIKYPSNFPKNEIEELYQVTETTPPLNEIIEGFVVDESYTQIWNARQKTSEELSNELINDALVALDSSDKVAIRCVKADIKFPSDWKAYVKDLRDVANEISTVLPEQPEYPAGT